MYFTVPTGPPQNIALTDVTSTSLNISWNPPLFSERNGLIIRYDITFEELPTNNITKYNTSDNSIYITNLHPYYNHSFICSAATIIGSGPLSSKDIFLTSEDGTSFVISCVIIL